MVLSLRFCSLGQLIDVLLKLFQGLFFVIIDVVDSIDCFIGDIFDFFLNLFNFRFYPMRLLDLFQGRFGVKGYLIKSGVILSFLINTYLPLLRLSC